MSHLSLLAKTLPDLLGPALKSLSEDIGELTLEINAPDIVRVCRTLHDHENCKFDQLIDLCGMDYSTYGTEGGKAWKGSRYAVVYHLLSMDYNSRIRLRVQLDPSHPAVDSIIGIWPVSDWFEREAFDLYGIVFNNHPDLRRLLTDYGFIGHPFRKDFPLSGNVEMTYDEQHGRVVYRPVTVEERVLVPRTIRTDTFAGTRRNIPGDPPENGSGR